MFETASRPARTDPVAGAPNLIPVSTDPSPTHPCVAFQNIGRLVGRVADQTTGRIAAKQGALGTLEYFRAIQVVEGEVETG